ncbi:MAG: hypothetical protein PWP16_319 [Eubacteriaceae bacterium]|jgi:CRISPR-associated Csx2 family protein|nr:hypothetical protein [Eubacteriaceae bacterium]MDK2937210.1 hypothetical protein [Eubacteriaceae bacterium]MDK2961842.1 hypothetical protein [Eubacteriaceae bacterium]MDN5306956.1 hypothetical protein [Eubacteriaceae bacterium]
MHIKLLSFLGTSVYQPVNYQLGNMVYPTHLIQEALVKHILKTKEAEDTLELHLYLTKDARERNFDGSAIISEIPEYKRLKEVLTVYGEEIKLKIFDVPDGRSEAEIWEIFDIMISGFSHEDRVYLDITHGFRSLPLMATAIADYSKQIYNIELEEIYYGAYEAKDSQNNAPIFCLKQFYTLEKWSTATDKFLSGGLTDIIELIGEELGRLKRIYHHDDPLLNSLSKLRKNLDGFVRSIKTNRTKDSIRYGIIIKECFANLEMIQNRDYQGLRPFLKILEKIESMVVALKDGEEYLIWNIHCITRQCYVFGMYQQVFTLLAENGTNCLLALCGIKPDAFFDRALREQVRRDYFLYCKECELTEYTMQMDKKYFNKTYQNFINNDFRNDVNHGGLSDKAVDFKVIEKNALNLIKTFEEKFAVLLN